MNKKRKKKKSKKILPRNKESNLANIFHTGAGSHQNKKAYDRKRERKKWKKETE